MTRGVGELAVAERVPELLVALFGVVTHLADTWFLFVLLAFSYWLFDDRFASHPRRVGATLIALVVTGLAVVTFGKYLLAAPRPPTDPGSLAWLPDVLVGWYEERIHPDGYGLPSGHAMGAVLAYSGLALLLERWSFRRRLAVAAVVVALVSASRLVLQVHYLVDVVASLAIGAMLLVVGIGLAAGRVWAPWAAIDRDWLDPTPIFLLAALLSVAAMFVAWESGAADGVFQGAVGLGTALGGAVGWRHCSGTEAAVPLPIVGAALIGTGIVWVGTLTIEPTVVVTIVATAAATAVILAVPALADRTGRP